MVGSPKSSVEQLVALHVARFLFLVGHTGFRESYARRKGSVAYHHNRNRRDQGDEQDGTKDDTDGYTDDENDELCPEKNGLFAESCFFSKYV